MIFFIFPVPFLYRNHVGCWKRILLRIGEDLAFSLFFFQFFPLLAWRREHLLLDKVPYAYARILFLGYAEQMGFFFYLALLLPFPLDRSLMAENLRRYRFFFFISPRVPYGTAKMSAFFPFPPLWFFFFFFNPPPETEPLCLFFCPFP